MTQVACVTDRQSERQRGGTATSYNVLVLHCTVKITKRKAELSHGWPRDVPYIWCPENFESPWVRPRLIFPKFLMRFCSDRLTSANPSRQDVVGFADGNPTKSATQRVFVSCH